MRPRNRLYLLLLASVAAISLAVSPAFSQCGPGGCSLPSSGWGSSPAAGQSPGIFRAPRKQQQAPPTAQAPANAHPAVCRIKNDFGRSVIGGTGTLIDRNEKYGLIVTNEHLVRDGEGKITCKFPGDYLTAKVIYKSAKYDLCILYTARPDVEPVEVAMTAPQIGEAVKTCGYGSGDYREVSGTIRTYAHQDPPQAVQIRGQRQFIRQGSPDGELNSFEASGSGRPGDSGSPIFNRRGQLVGVMWGGDRSQFSGTPCTLVDQVALTAGRYLLPWNAKVNDPARDPRNQPPQVQVQGPGVQVDPAPLNRDLADTQKRLDETLAMVYAHETVIAELRQTEAVAKRLAEEWPDLKTALVSLEALGEEQEAATKAAEAADSKAEAAVTVSQKTAEATAEAIDEDNPKGPLGKLRARIDAAKKEGAEGAKQIAKAVAMGLLQTYGFPAGIALLVLGFVVWDVRKKVNEGDPLLVEKVAARVHERVGPIRERIRDRFSDEEEEGQPRGPKGRFVKRAAQ